MPAILVNGEGFFALDLRSQVNVSSPRVRVIVRISGEADQRGCELEPNCYVFSNPSYARRTNCRLTALQAVSPGHLPKTNPDVYDIERGPMKRKTPSAKFQILSVKLAFATAAVSL
jgi:hypothetical protein